MQTAKDLEEEGKSARIARNQIDGLYRQSEDISVEWSAEVQYVQAALALLRERQEGTGDAQFPVLIGGEGLSESAIRLESRPDFILLQRIAEGAELLPGFRPNHAAINDHREFLNHVLDQNAIDPFLLRLDGKERDQAAALLGQAVISLVPENRLQDLENGSARLSEFDGLLDDLAREMASQVARSKRIDFSSLNGLDGRGSTAVPSARNDARRVE